MSWEEWLEQLIDHARTYSTPAARSIAKASFMYEDYFEDGLTPQEAFEEEWG